jgi:uncharacterized protein (TIGR02996 family)
MKNDAFLQAILDAPDDDTPRLVYADWLDEHGDPERAEFIRVQCELARLRELDPQRVGLEAKGRTLLAAAGTAWVGPLVGLTKEWIFRRGFVEGITMGGKGFLLYADYLFKQAPLQEVRLRWVYVDHLAALPLLARLSRLTLFGDVFSDQCAKHLADSPYLSARVMIDLREAQTYHLSERGRQLLTSRFGARVLI